MGWREFNESSVGDKITINRWGGAGYRQQPYEFRTIIRKLKTAIVDDKGDKWTNNGDRWGYTNGWSSSGVSARKFREQDVTTNRELRTEQRQTNQREKLRAAVDKNWKTWDMRKINQLLAVIYHGEGAKESKSE